MEPGACLPNLHIVDSRLNLKELGNPLIANPFLSLVTLVKLELPGMRQQRVFDLARAR
jgi:hypothetical protein